MVAHSGGLEKPRKKSSVELQDELLKELALPQKLDAWNQLSQEIAVPPEFAAAIITGRPELLKAGGPARALTAEEAGKLYHAFATLVETNMALQQHSQRLAKMVAHWAGAFTQLESLGQRIRAFSEFKSVRPGDEEAEAA